MVSGGDIAKQFAHVKEHLGKEIKIDKDGIKEAINKLIWHLESYDVTTIRASTPMYFLSKAITEEAMGHYAKRDQLQGAYGPGSGRHYL